MSPKRLWFRGALRKPNAMLNTDVAHRLSGRIYFRTLTVFTLIAFLTPLIVIDSRQNARARTTVPQTAAPPNNPPPQPFRIGSDGSPMLSVNLATTLATWFGKVLGNDKTVVPAASANDFELKSTFGKLGPRDTGLEPAEAPPVPPQPAAAVDFDFDEDGKADISRWHPQTTEFKIHNSQDSSYSTYTLGSSGGKPVPADYDGDGKADVATFSSGTWTIRKSSDGNTTTVSGFGQSGDIPVPGNYTNSNADDNLAVYRPSNGTWYWRELGDTTVYSQSWGASTDIPAPGDYNGTGGADFAVFRPSDGTWYVLNNGGGWAGYQWGVSTDIPVAADYDADGKTDPAVFRPSTGQWWVLFSANSHTTYEGGTWGAVGDQPLVGDFDGDSKADWSVWRPTTGKWFIRKSSNSSSYSESLGANGDTVLPSSYIKQVGSQISPDIINQARLSPKNATGGTNLYSQNFSWGTSLVSLPGRSGLDLGVGISYNSLVWTKVGTTMLFDTDASNVAPGFRIGFPAIEPAYYNDETDKFNYLMVTPGGSRVEFRQQGAGSIYETYDSSYTQLEMKSTDSPNDPPEDIVFTVTAADGTQMVYGWIGGAFRCTQITDRNGNYISVAYDPYDNGLIDHITDTLGRVVTFNYDSNAVLTSISQTWKDNNGSGSNTTHTYASFSYTTKTIATDFDGLNIWGTYNGIEERVLDKITYADGSFTKFHYNGYAQVYKIENHAPNSTTGTPHILNYVRTNLESPTSGQTDCPRFTLTASKVENFNLSGGPGTEQEIKVHNSEPQSGSYSLQSGTLTGSGAVVDVYLEGHPDDLHTKTYYGSSGWKEGLTLATEDCLTTSPTSCSNRKRWTWSDWDQDDTGVSYQTNPRVIETRVGDDTNTKRTTIEYTENLVTGQVLYGLPKTVQVYDSSLSNVLKKVKTEYNLDSAYTSRRIIGLPSKSEAWGWNDLTSSLEYVSKVTYEYDTDDDFATSGLNQDISPVQHDNTNYGAAFSLGRGNLTTTTRWNVEYPTNSSEAVTTTVEYNTAGSVVAKITPWDGTNTRTVKIGYADNWNSTVSGATYAYPTSITDSANNSSTVKYRYDIGANVEATSPAPAGNSQGKITEREFNSLGRLSKERIVNNGAYTRYEYPANGIQSKVFSTIIDTDNDGADADDEVLTESWTDGAGRVLRSRSPHPGSDGGWSATLSEFDVLGRLKRQSAPREVDSDWDPSGDDSAGEWKWITTEYDWKDRSIRTISPDGTDTLTSYQGCGCAGGLVTTVQGELVNVPGQSNTQARRTQKFYADVLGRTFKVEALDWSNNVYSTMKTLFNGRDQVVTMTEYAGTDSSSTSQVTSATYDGHGRLSTRHVPEQDSEKNTVLTYNPDDSIATVTDARDVVKSNLYNSRGLLTQTTYTLPQGSTIQQTPSVSISFDNVGNPVQMTDGMATTSYAYNELSQLLSETKAFVDTMPNAPLENNSFKIEYTYGLNGQLASLKDPFGQQFNYVRDSVGSTKQINGSTSFGGVTSYLSDVKYRAWGAPKETTYGNGLKMLATFDQNLMTASYTLTNPSTSVNIMRKEYEYYPDNNLRYSEDLNTPKHDRLYEYDFGLRLTKARSGPEARGQTPTYPDDVPFREDFTHNAFGHMTSQTGDWRPGTDCSRDDFSDSNTFLNNRNTHSGASYDADGRQLHLMGIHKRFDARGSMIKLWNGLSDYDLVFAHDGNGREVKRTEKVWDSEEMDWSEPETVYYIRSSVLGGKILTEVASTGAKAKTYIYAGNEVLAEQNVNIEDNSSQSVAWEHWDASGVARVRTKPDGSTYIGGEEIDPLGHKFNGACFPPRPDRGYGNLQFGSSSLIDWSLFGSSNYGEGCFYEGVPELCQNITRAIGRGHGSVGEIRIFGPLPVFSDQSGRWEEGAIDQMIDELRYLGESESILVSRNMGGTQDSSVTVKAGSPIYLITSERKLPQDELNRLKANLERLIDDPDCSKFIEKLISNLPDSNTVQIQGRELVSKKFDGGLIENFDRTRKQYGFWIGSTVNEAYSAVTNLRGITFNETKYNRGGLHPWPGGFHLTSVELSGQQSNTLTLIHELLHMHYLPPVGQKGVLSVDHNAMAIAAQKSLVDSGIVKTPIPITGSSAYYFQDALVLACGKVRL